MPVILALLILVAGKHHPVWIAWAYGHHLHLADWLGVAGIAVALIGFGLTLHQVREAKREATNAT